MAHRLLLCTSWFRPQLGLDMGTDLLDRLNRKGLKLVGVIGPDEEKLASEARDRGLPYFPLLPEFQWTSQTLRRRLTEDFSLASRMEQWVDPIRRLNAELGVLYFATWIPPALLAVPQRGWLNFHPAPLPELRGFLPEDFAVLWGWKTMPGTLHVATEEIDEGPILLKSRPARLNRWDTPDSVMQKVGQTARSCLASGIKDYLNGQAVLVQQKQVPGFFAGYTEFYPESYLNWETDDHAQLHRRFQTFRGQHHRVELKARFDDGIWQVETLELHRCRAKGRPGDLLATWNQLKLIRTTQGVALVGCKPFVKDPGLASHLDRQQQQIIPAGSRPQKYHVSEFRHLIR